MNHGKGKVAGAWRVGAVGLLGFLCVGSSALDLSADGIARYLNSDFFTPYFFCRELLTRRFPLSGWTLSASPYFVPDHLVLGGLFSMFGATGFAYVLFTLVYYPLLFGLAVLCLRNAVGRGGPALVAGLLFGGGLLALRALPGHAQSLWWLGAPCCHGGVLLLGFGYLSVLGTGLRRGRVGTLPGWLFALGLLGLVSDTLFLFQILLPASVALFLCRRRHPALGPWWRWQSGCLLAALAGSVGFKGLCGAESWFYFSRMIRVSPTPAHQWHALGQFLGDVPFLLQNGWGFALVLLAAVVSLARTRAARETVTPENAPADVHRGVLDFYRVFCVASLGLMLPLPILTCAWRSANCVRYVFNWLVLPGFLLALRAAERWTLGEAVEAEMGRRRRGWVLVGVAAVFLVGTGWAVRDLRTEPRRFPYPEDVAALDAVLQRRGLTRGLAEYWDAKYVTGLSHAGAELRQIKMGGEPYFWDNNAFDYYERGADGALRWPEYQYVLVELLDEPAIRRAFGEPVAKESAGPFQVWVYGEDGRRRIRETLEPAVRRKLGER